MPTESPRKTSQRATVGSIHPVSWVMIATVLGAAILIFDFITKAIGVVDKLSSLIVPAPVPKVAIKALSAPGNSQCLEFTFTDLPQNFVLGEIRLSVGDASGPVSITGDQSATILQRKVNAEIPLSEFVNREPIVFLAAIQAEKAKDIAYVDYCPVLDRKGQSGTLVVTPKFFKPDGTQISKIDTTIEGGGTSIAFTITYPNNINAIRTNALEIAR